jgi:hypothetical protein
MGWFNRDKVNSIVPYANSGQLKPRVGAKPDTHTVRDDSQNTTQAMTQRRVDRDAASASGPHSGYVNPSGGDAMGPKKPNIKIGAEYTTYHEPGSSEGKAILKDKSKSAKALKSVNNPKAMAKSKAAGQSYDVAKAEETKRMGNNKMLGLKDGDNFADKPSGSESAYLKGGAKGEQAYRQNKNRKRIKGGY